MSTQSLDKRKMEVPDLKTPIDTLISNAKLLTMNHERREIEHGSIAIKGDEILALGAAAELKKRYTPLREIDATDMLALPGLINGHNHLFQVMCRGLGDGFDTSDWAQHAIWPLAPFFSGSVCEVAASLACVEMIESGTTTVVDSHYLHADADAHDGIAQACLNSGIRAILGRAAMDLSNVPELFRETPEGAIRATERFMQKWNGKAGRLMVRPEAMNEIQVSRELILKLRELSRETKTGFHMHAAASRSRPESLKKEVGFRTIEYLNHLGVLGPEVVLAHCVWLNEDEIKMMAESDTAVMHNPIANQYLADGVAPVPEFLSMGVRVCIGTDGAASNNSQDMFEVMKAASLLHKVHHLRADLMKASDVIELATIKGAKALGIDGVTGSLEPGKKADIVLLNQDCPRMISCYSTVSNLVYSASSQMVHTVIIDGRIVAEGGKCVSLNRKEVLNEARKVTNYLKTKVNL
jgi:5-methylthioadenosine/S-adenosylhomocysteine deaminase